ncbi:AmmeMemoRadiSam system radical SAM enzyme [Bowdeniella nasicola]|uniref:AmmeMemoRadiSam system radical SAM enzyme n=1 Tax=Bowdeniella nasicola TaxID=208480 RepID=A0A1Q5Q3L1_9ACTO|nr:AmmeMemoRadiSam system radical SAM enzyme [Bowdeniella nasicola]OKL54413.1 AmmeMemoRadiSam system radical SAM enzyme [Bowdeniella nasicola]
MSAPAKWWHRTDDGRVRCEVCPRLCTLRDGQRGYCFVRMNVDGALLLDTYGRSSGFAIDPIEKKPLNHFLPGSRILSFGTAGCNLGCKFCQNYTISTSRHFDSLSQEASPSQIAEAALRYGAKSVAFTYNDPVIFAEYAIDTAHACREVGIHPVAVTAGHMTEQVRGEFFSAMDATNIDLKGFTNEFYRKITGGRLETVLATLEHVAATDTHLEITTLTIEGHNDSDAELAAMSRWIVEHLGPDVPHHFSAFHPDHRMRDVPPTKPATLSRAREIALAGGERYVYTGNIYDPAGQSTRCHECQEVVIARDRYRVGEIRLDVARDKTAACRTCGAAVPGVFA